MIIWSTFRKRLIASFPENGELVYNITHSLYKHPGWKTLSVANSQSEVSYEASLPRHGLDLTDIYVSPDAAIRSIQFCTPAHKALAEFRHSSISRKSNDQLDFDSLQKIFDQGRFGTSVLGGFNVLHRSALWIDLPEELIEIMTANLREIVLSQAWFTLIDETNPETIAAVAFLKEGNPLITLETSYPTFRGEILVKSRPQLKDKEPRS